MKIFQAFLLWAAFYCLTSWNRLLRVSILATTLVYFTGKAKHGTWLVADALICII